MSENPIKYHEDSNTYITRKNSFFEREINIDGNLIVGSGSNFWKDVNVKGVLELGKGTFVKGNVKADEAIVGARSEINGNIEVAGDLKIFDSVKIEGSAIAGDEMHVRPGSKIGFAKASRTMELVGKVSIKEIESGTKIIVRSE
ncbi:polymer-forming cytoskeletal protein [uncultured Methanolobus sp.]|uniref:polymer-forming cytoskeletal protein n=1 Tax=uncultured Methanolobus sp. TaxID=218300 RepID=UPI002AAA9351|nr:polymer-forming cytoskeletal protein [uncultured Methanolobus sp.]